jgi:quercetin dioxygenase-like cupin family protein
MIHFALHWKSQENLQMKFSPKSMRGALTILCAATLASHIAWTHAAHASPAPAAPPAAPPTKDRASILLSHALPKLDGDHLNATLVEVRYGPGESSPPHSHPCAVIGYVVEGSLRTQVQGEPEAIYKAGESFYEAPGGVHAVSANASATEPAKFVAFLICDHQTPLSVDVPKNSEKGN